MGLPTEINDHLLFVASRPTDRLLLSERVVASALERDGVIVAVADRPGLTTIRAAAEAGGLDSRRFAGVSTEEVDGDSGVAWRTICDRLDSEVSSAAPRGQSRSVIIAVDLDAVFARCQAVSEMMSVVYHLDREHAARGRAVATVASVVSLSRSLPTDFFIIPSTLVFGSWPSRAGTDALDGAVEQLAVASPEFRQRFLASTREGSETAIGLLPRFLEDFRIGILVVDMRFIVRFCSARAAELLGKSAEEMVGRPITTCVDGVDLVTVKHECEKLRPGVTVAPPFVASWRVASGVYEPRHVHVDPVRSGHQTVGYLIGLSRVEPVRGPRAVYEQLKAEKAHPEATPGGTDDEVVLSSDDAVSGDLHGTQITRREHEVILLILRGMTNREIANYLKIAEVTVKKHLTSVYRKLRITSRRELGISFSRPGSDS